MAPELSVVVPTHGRPAALGRCLAGLSRQTLDSERFEVVVVDDGGFPAAEPAKAGVETVLVRHQRPAGPAAARNHGAARARGRFLAFTDDDCVPEPEWLESLLARLVATPNALVAGRVENADPRDPFATATQAIFDFVAARGSTPFATANNLAADSAHFSALGGFDAAGHRWTGEDRELCTRWAESGRPFLHVPEAVVRHAPTTGFRSFLRQHAAYGRGSSRFHARRGKRLPERPGFYVDLIRSPLGGGRTREAWTQAALVALAQAATATGAMRALLGQRVERR